MNVTHACPILQVSDLNKAIDFYCRILGFSNEFAYGDPPYYASVRLGGVDLHLNASAENAARRGLGSVYVYCDEVDAYYQQLHEQGVNITSPLNSYPYGMRDFQIRDLDGNLICFGCVHDDEEL